MIFEVAVTNKMTLSSNTFDDTGWSFGAISSRAAEIIPTYRLFGMINIQRQPGYSGSDPPYKVILGVWRKDDRNVRTKLGMGHLVINFLACIELQFNEAKVLLQ